MGRKNYAIYPPVKVENLKPSFCVNFPLSLIILAGFISCQKYRAYSGLIFSSRSIKKNFRDSGHWTRTIYEIFEISKTKKKTVERGKRQKRRSRI